MTEITPNVVQQMQNGTWRLASPLAQNGKSLFAVTTNWCGHCKDLKQLYVPEAQLIEPFKFFYMDGEKSRAHENVSQALGVQGYPAVYKVGRNGTLTEYNGSRKPAQLARAINA